MLYDKRNCYFKFWEYSLLYNNATFVCMFIGCCPWSIRWHTHRWCQIVFFVFFHAPNMKHPTRSSINHLNFYCIKRIDYIFPCVRVYCNSMICNSMITRLRLVTYFLFFTRCDVVCDLLQYTRTGKCNLFVNYKSNQIIQREDNESLTDRVYMICIVCNQQQYYQQQFGLEIGFY